MTITIETMKEAKQVASELRLFLEDRGHAKQHAINSCGCSVCKSARAMSEVANDLLREYEHTKP